ncbi:MAG TPA: 2-isopropylmalate synthase [Pyrinomonadaceae bacterium]|nr:2-isopropylmalate synthase [Chloracidobacterium sp.]HBE83931.1 2-isopropylmalate synthase [Blastocatellia bacterium]HRJ87445.1 2-isopropylmalate synthase [Pyrinomonadaceae bacterium]HRK49820.1 2-isopropylmalate synthase [Pyrinomonadaceae bacterium]
MQTKRISIFDTTLRDGEQSPGCSMYLNEKIDLALQLENLGVDVIEAGFPIASYGDFRSVKAVSDECGRATVAALCRTVEDDVLRAAEALRSARHPRIHTFVATSDIHLEFKLKKTRSEVIAMTRNAVKLARGLAAEVEFSAEDATRSDVGFLCEVFSAAVDEGATILNVPDTVGYTLPTEFGELVKTVRESVVGDRSITISVHCHNDLGLAVANSIAAIGAGASQIECTINGIGERAGNASLEEVIMACAVRSDKLPVTTGIDTTQLYPTSQLLSSIISFGVQPNKAIVGRNAFAHEAGIHQHGVLSNPLCYEIMTPESVGVPKNSIVLGKHSGRHALIARYGELGFAFDADEINEIYSRFVSLADRKKNIYDQDLLSIVPDRMPTAIAA